MEDILVHNCSQILCLLLKGKLNVNSIIKQTSIYKNNVFEANMTLKKAGLVISSADEHVHKQMKFIDLTEFGHELAEIIEKTYEFEISYLELQKKIKENFIAVESTDEKVRNRKLMGKGWKSEEINNYEEWLDIAISFENEILSMLIEGITNRYAILLLKFNLNKNAKEILVKVITNILTKYLLIRLENLADNELFKCLHCGENFPKEHIAKYRAKEMTDEFNEQVFDFIDDFAFSLINNRFINKEAKNVIASFFSVIKLPKESVTDHLKKQGESLNEAGTKYPNNKNIKNHKQVLSLYEELIR